MYRTKDLTRRKKIEQEFKTYKNYRLKITRTSNLSITITISRRTDLTDLKHGRLLGT